MRRAVLDTNILASAFVTPGGVPDQLLQLWLLDRFELIVCDEIIDELIGVFEKPYFRARMSDQRAAENIALLRRYATIAPITRAVSGIATHPEDDLILSVAVSTQADYLVTGDGPFRRAVPTYAGVTLISPREFLTLLQASATS